jgi:hypothetical protein
MSITQGDFRDAMVFVVYLERKSWESISYADDVRAAMANGARFTLLQEKSEEQSPGKKVYNPPGTEWSVCFFISVGTSTELSDFMSEFLFGPPGHPDAIKRKLPLILLSVSASEL